MKAKTSIKTSAEYREATERSNYAWTHGVKTTEQIIEDDNLDEFFSDPNYAAPVSELTTTGDMFA